MNEIITIHILKAIKENEISFHKDYYWVYSDYFIDLNKIFSLGDIDELKTIVRNTFKELGFNFKIVSSNLKELSEDLNFFNDYDFTLKMISECKLKVIIKQQYVEAARLRDLERKTMDMVEQKNHPTK